jgi:hypothetical protein
VDVELGLLYRTLEISELDILSRKEQSRIPKIKSISVQLMMIVQQPANSQVQSGLSQE